MIDLLAAVRSIHLAATVMASGGVIFLVVLADPALQSALARMPAGARALRRQIVWLAWVALAVAVGSGVSWLLLLAADIYGAPIIEVCLHGGAWSLIADTRFGQVWSGRFGVALLLGLSLGVTVRRRGVAAKFLAIVRVVLALVLLASISYTGHAGTTPGTAGNFHLLSDGLHLIAAGVWTGGLPPLALLLWRGYRERAPAWRLIITRVVTRFSVLGIASVGVLFASGIFNTWISIGTSRDLIDTEYGRFVLLKVCLFAAMVGIAAVNRFYLTPRLASRVAVRKLGRNSIAEIALAGCVMIFVGILGTLSPPIEAHVRVPELELASDAAFIHIHSEDGMADVAVTPGRPGAARVTIRLLNTDFSVLPARAITFTFARPNTPQEKVIREATKISDANWAIDGLQIPKPGIWNLQVIVRFDDKKDLLLDGPIVIER